MHSDHFQYLCRCSAARLWGGEPLGPAARAALAEGVQEIESLAGQWDLWSGQVGQIRLWNRANAKTVMAAYQALTNRTLEPIVREIAKPE